MHTATPTTVNPSTTEAEPGFELGVVNLAAQGMTDSFASPIMNFLELRGEPGHKERTTTPAMVSNSPYLPNITTQTAMLSHSSVVVTVPLAPTGMSIVTDNLTMLFVNILQIRGGTGHKERTTTTAMVSDSPYLPNITMQTTMPSQQNCVVATILLAPTGTTGVTNSFASPIVYFPWMIGDTDPKEQTTTTASVSDSPYLPNIMTPTPTAMPSQQSSVLATVPMPPTATTAVTNSFASPIVYFPWMIGDTTATAANSPYLPNITTGTETSCKSSVATFPMNPQGTTAENNSLTLSILNLTGTNEVSGNTECKGITSPATVSHTIVDNKKLLSRQHLTTVPQCNRQQQK